MLTGEKQQAALQRVKRITGQIQGLGRMIDEQRYCIDTLTQIRAAEAALHKLGELILRNHLETCVVDAFESSDREDRRAKVEELIRVFGAMRAR